MDTILEFKTRDEFKRWLISHHETSKGVHIFLYKKGHEDKGLTYEEAVRTALCYGWIDAVTHGYNEEKFIQYFAKRKKNSKWSLSNIKRMKLLIDKGLMTPAGLTYFDLTLLSRLDQLIEEERLAKINPVEIPVFFTSILEERNAKELFKSASNATQRHYIAYILDAKKEATKIRRCEKIIRILNGEKNNL